MTAKCSLPIEGVKAALEKTGGQRTAAAAMLNVERSTLQRFLARHDLLRYAQEIDEDIRHISSLPYRIRTGQISRQERKAIRSIIDRNQRTETKQAA